MRRKNKLLVFILVVSMLLPLFHVAGMEFISDIPAGESGFDSGYISGQEYIIDTDTVIRNSIIIKIGSNKALANGRIKQIDETNPNVVPFIDENKRALAPVRFIAENLGYYVDYDPQENKVSILSFIYMRQIYLIIGINFIVVNNEYFLIDTAPKITPEGRTFIPLRAFIEKGLNRNVAYVSSEQMIIISDFDIGGDDSELAKEVSEKVKAIFYDGFIYSGPVYDELVYTNPVYYTETGYNGPVWPLDMAKVTRDLKNWPSYTDGTYHAGTDFAVPLGSNVYSTYDGVVDTVKDLGNISYGKYIIIKSTINGNVRHIYYGHLDKQTVQEGDKVKAGDKIGESGNTGNSLGPHLHYEVRNENKEWGSLNNPTFNPYDYLPESE